MASVALVSVLGPDRVGLVAAIAEHLFNIGVNLRDTTFAAQGPNSSPCANSRRGSPPARSKRL
jgi:glycine cleavage system regulatory protein